MLCVMSKGRHSDGVDGDFHVLATFAQSRGIVTITQLTDTGSDDDSLRSSSASPWADSEDNFSLNSNFLVKTKLFIWWSIHSPKFLKYFVTVVCAKRNINSV